jgi:hypothetical protein
MEITRLSTEGQNVLRPSGRFPETRLEDVVGCLRTRRKAASLVQMDAAIAREIVRRRVRNRY